MRLTILYEDQRSETTKGFGPHELLLSCLIDRAVSASRFELSKVVRAHPVNGVGGFRSKFQKAGKSLLDSGPVFVAIDRDKIGDFVKVPFSSCRTKQIEALKGYVQGSYTTILVDQNTESVVASVCRALRIKPPAGKPSPIARDDLFNRAAWSEPGVRQRICSAPTGFGRLVDKVEQALIQR